MPIVRATAVPNPNAATKLKNAAQITACAGERTRVDTTVAIEFAEHDVIGASLADQHGIMTAAQPASAGDPVRFEHGNGRDKAYSTAQMRAVGASAHHNVRMAVDDKRDIATLHHGGELFCSLDQRALISFLKP